MCCRDTVVTAADTQATTETPARQTAVFNFHMRRAIAVRRTHFVCVVGALHPFHAREFMP